MAPAQQHSDVDETHSVEERGEIFEKELLIEEGRTEKPTLTKDGNAVDAENKTLCAKVKGWAKQCIRYYLDNYVLLILTGSVGSALSATSVKILSAKISVMELAAGRAFFAALILLAACFWSNTPLTTYRSLFPLIIVRGMLGSAAYICQSLATSMLPLADSVFIFNSYPVTTALLSSLFGIERLGILAWCGVIGCLAGNALIAHPPFLFGGHEEWGQERLVGILFALSGTILVSIMFIVLKRVGKSVSSLVLSISMNVFTMLFAVPCMSLGYPKAVGLSLHWVYIFPFLMTILSGTAVTCAMSRAFQIGPPSKVTALFMTSTLLAAAISVLALNEKMSWISMMGASTILLSVLLVQTPNPAKNEKNSYQAVATAEPKETIEMSIQQKV